MSLTNPDALAKIGRLAMRQEGDNWVAYYALSDTMQGAIFLGSIRMGAVVNNPARKQAFMDMMWDIFADIFEQKVGERPTRTGAQRAPEHERSGAA